ECAVLGNDDPVASIAGEIVPEGHEFYDYSAKYLDAEGARLLIPAAISDEVLGRVQSMSVRAFRAIECAGMARVDFFLRGDDELAELVDRLRLRADDDVVGPGHVLRFGDAGDRSHRARDRCGLANLGLDQDVRVHHGRRPPVAAEATC